MARTDAHEALLKGSAGYGAFVAEEQEMDPEEDDGLLVGFADWLLAPNEAPGEYADWRAEDFRREWDRWNS